MESRGTLRGVPDELRATGKRPRIRDLPWWLAGEVGEFDCPPDT